MNQVDALLLVLLTPFALRGLWRGLCREAFGLAGMLGGAAAAGVASPRLATILMAHQVLPPLAARRIVRRPRAVRRRLGPRLPVGPGL